MDFGRRPLMKKTGLNQYYKSPAEMPSDTLV